MPRTLESRRQRNLEEREWFRSLKSGISCSICGESHPACIDFHHNDPFSKKSSVSRMIGKCASRESVLMEIEKCTALCANCHRKLHYAAPQ